MYVCLSFALRGLVKSDRYNCSRVTVNSKKSDSRDTGDTRESSDSIDRRDRRDSSECS